MKSSLNLLIGLMAILVISFAYAVKVNSVYTADVSVASQTTEDRIAAEEPALAQVLVKLSGDTQVTNNPDIADRLKRADRLVQEFSYSPSPETPKTPYILHVVFDTDAVNHILRNGKVATWGENRPLILIWMTYEAPNQPTEIVGADIDINIQNLFKKHADQRGLPILIPVMDISDMNQVAVNDITTMSIPTLQNAAKRYGNDAMLIVRLLKNTDGYGIQSKLIKNNDQWDFNLTGKTMDNVVSQLMNNVTNTLAGRYGSIVSNNVQTQFTLKVTGISAQSDLAAAMKYIKHLAPVADVQPIDISDNEALLTVSLRGSQDAFVSAVAGEEKLQPVADTVDPSVLVYQWNP